MPYRAVFSQTLPMEGGGSRSRRLDVLVETVADVETLLAYVLPRHFEVADRVHSTSDRLNLGSLTVEMAWEPRPPKRQGQVTVYPAELVTHFKEGELE